MGQIIRANSMLPALREEIELHTADGLTLVGELATPERGEPVATLICLHPLPTHGGMMDSHILRKAAWRLPALAQVAVLRLNTRGTSSVRGTSEGAYDHGVGEQRDLDAALDFARARRLPALWELGWSFGTDVILRHGPVPDVAGVILLSPPLRTTADADLAAWADTPVTALVPEFDDYLRPPEAIIRFAPLARAQIVAMSGSKHLWVGDTERVLDEIVARVAPAAYPLPREWDGPMTMGDSSAYSDRSTSVFRDKPLD